MEADNQDTATVITAIGKNFDINLPDNADFSAGRDQIVTKLTRQIEYLLRNNQERLWQGLYRVDVAETKVKEAFRLGSLEEIAGKLAGLILDREIQKAILRRKYRQGH